MASLFNLSSLLERFKKLKDPRENKILISNIISEGVGVKIEEKDISIQKNVLYISGSSLLKNRIFLKKAHIIEKIHETIPELKIQDIF